jgi:hypothetical protein
LLWHIIRSAGVSGFTQADFLLYAEAIAGVGGVRRQRFANAAMAASRRRSITMCRDLIVRSVRRMSARGRAFEDAYAEKTAI